MKQYQEIISTNRRELMPVPEDLDEGGSETVTPAEPKEDLDLM